MWSSPATLGDTSLMNIRSKRLVSGADGCARVCQPQTHWSLPSALRQGCLPWSSSFIHLQNTSFWFWVIVISLWKFHHGSVIAEERTWTQSFALQEGAYVAQYKFTVLLMPNGPHKITGAQTQHGRVWNKILPMWVTVFLCRPAFRWGPLQVRALPWGCRDPGKKFLKIKAILKLSTICSCLPQGVWNHDD